MLDKKISKNKTKTFINKKKYTNKQIDWTSSI